MRRIPASACLVLCFACVGSRSDSAGPLPIGETPPAPAAECSEPPSVISVLAEQQNIEMQEALDATRAELFDPSAITIVLCGTGTPIPSARAQSCTAVFVNGLFLLFDAGDGAARSMESLDMPITDLTALFLTHYHSDHIADVGAVISQSWILGRQGTLPIYGGQAIDRVVDGFNSIYALDYNYRVAHHGETAFPQANGGATAFPIADPGPDGTIVFEQSGVSVRAFTVDHSPILPALGYRVEYAGKSVVISGDTIDTEGLRTNSRGADILVSEVINKSVIEDVECALDRLGWERNATLTKDIRTYHIDVEELAELAQEAGVATLVLTHQVPTVDDPDQVTLIFEAPVSAIYEGELVIARDGDRVTLPVD